MPEDEPPRLEGVQYATRDEWWAITNSSRKNELARQKPKWCSVVDVSGGESKVWCCKEQYCIGIRNVRSMNQGKLNMVKQEMARLNFEILGISELKWMGMGEFNSNGHFIYYSGEESHRRNRASLIVNKRVQNAVPEGNLKIDGMTCLKREKEGYLGSGLKSDSSLSPHWWDNAPQNHRAVSHSGLLWPLTGDTSCSYSLTYLWTLVSCLWISFSIFLYGGFKPVFIILSPH